MDKTVETTLSEKTFLRRLEENCPYRGGCTDTNAFSLKRDARRFRIEYRLSRLARGQRQPKRFLYGEYHLDENGCVVVNYRLAYSLGRKILTGTLFLVSLALFVSVFLEGENALEGMLTELFITGLFLVVAFIGLLVETRTTGARLERHLRQICLADIQEN